MELYFSCETLGFENCIICMENRTNFVAHNGGIAHKICRGCAREWTLRNDHMPSCPVCRIGIDPASILTDNEMFEWQLTHFLKVGHESPREIDRVAFSVGVVAICLGSIASNLIF